MTEDEMVRWHHRLNGHGFGLTIFLLQLRTSRQDPDALVEGRNGARNPNPI